MARNGMRDAYACQRREEKRGRKGKGREGKERGREGKGREGKERKGKHGPSPAHAFVAHDDALLLAHGQLPPHPQGLLPREALQDAHLLPLLKHVRERPL